jgi:hypothetical protein
VEKTEKSSNRKIENSPQPADSRRLIRPRKSLAGQQYFMEVTFQIPDELVSSVTAAGDLSRCALEAFALEELRAGRITEVQLCDMLSLARIQMDGFLKSHGVFEEYTLEDFEEERRALKELGL